ncbi:MAG TPA: NADH-quinone oxidoreductase subunit I [Myxococcaceae bacterium]|nr:NADH-quinone oxidoreductase subunit I [Myxococcaceae bacterium]
MKSYFVTAARALAVTFSNVFRRPVTVEFPDVIRPRAERYRASFALLHEEDGDEACIGCLQCERICPSEVISIKAGGKRESPITGKKRGYADDFVLDLNACIYCELCVQVCPTDAIVMTREPELPAFGREDLVLTMAKLYANEKAKHRAWGDATRLNAMQTPPKPPKAAAPAGAPAAGAPTAAEASARAAAPVVASPLASGSSTTASGSSTPPVTAPAPVGTASPAASVPASASGQSASGETGATAPAASAAERGSTPPGSTGEGTP